MKSETLNDQLFEVMLKHAVHEYCEEYLATLPSDEELKRSGAYEPSKQFDEKMKKLVAKSKKTKVLHHLPAVLKKIAAVFIFVLGLISFSLITIPPVYATIKEVTMKWFPQYTSYEFNGNAADIKNAEWEFTYIPNGYELSETYLIAEAKYSIYTNEAEEIIFTNIDKLSNEPKIYMDNENSVYSQIQLNGATAELYVANSENEISHLVWTQDGYTFYINGNLHKDELVKMAEGTKLVK